MGGGHLITTGTDDWSGFRIHNELFALAYIGLPLHAVLKAVTINGASALGVSDSLGTIEAGKIADVYIMRGNPAPTPSHLSDSRAADHLRPPLHSHMLALV